MYEVDLSVLHGGALRRAVVSLGLDHAPTKARVATLAERVTIDRGEIKAAATRHLTRQYHTADAIEELSRFVSNTWNLGQKIPSKILTAYRYQPTRRIDGASEDEATVFADLVRTSELPAIMPQLARTAWWCGPVYLLPRPSRSGVKLDVWYASNVVVQRDGDEILGFVGIDYRPRPEVQPGQPSGYTIADATGIYRYNSRGELMSSYPADRCLAVEIRSRPRPPTSDPADELHFGASLHDGALDYARVAAEMSQVRKAQNAQQIVLQGRYAGQAQGNTRPDGPEQFALNVEGAVSLGPDEALQIANFATSPEQFLRHLDAIESEVLANYGVGGAATVNAPGAYEHAAMGLAAHRALQVAALTTSETAALECLRDAARLWGIVDLPAGRIVVHFADGHAVDDPLRAEQLYREQAARGGTNPVEAYLRDHPSATEEQARRAVEANIAETTRITRALTHHAAPAAVDPSAVVFQTPEQQTGREGGRENGEV